VAVDVGKILPNNGLQNDLKCHEPARNKKPHSAQFHPCGHGLSRRKQGVDSTWGRQFFAENFFKWWFGGLMVAFYSPIVSSLFKALIAASRPGFT